MVLFSTPDPDNKDAGENDYNISIQFIHKAGLSELSLDSNYVNDHGETFSINRFKYYISNIEWHNREKDQHYKVKGGYFLIDEAEPMSKQIEMKIPAGRYTSVSFIVGVDSLKNVSGAQDGALDPINGMFWTWQTGYIMAKLEGTSPASTLPRKMIEFHIGGFKGPNNVLAPIEVKFPDEVVVTNRDHPASAGINVDIKKWFSGKHSLPIVRYPACTFAGKLAKQYAENYQSMFSPAAIK